MNFDLMQVSQVVFMRICNMPAIEQLDALAADAHELITCAPNLEDIQSRAK